MNAFRYEIGSRFRITAQRLADNDVRTFIYDNGLNTLTDEVTGEPVKVPQRFNMAPPHRARFEGWHEKQPAQQFSPTDPLRKTDKVRVLKISLGLSCNYSCEYCSQRFVPHADETSSKDLPTFLGLIEKNVEGAPQRVEFWGGEPFVYWKTLRPLAEALRAKWPDAGFSVITNGSLMDFEKVDWLDRIGFAVAVSHDGPGQAVRGPDPLDEPKVRAAILGLYQRLRPKGRISFNAMLNRSNLSRAAIQKFFVELTGDVTVPIGEGSVVSPYDEGGLNQSLDRTAGVTLRRTAFNEARNSEDANFILVGDRIKNWMHAFSTNRPRDSLGSSCGMEKEDTIAVDLKGNVLTCQNVSSNSTAPNGESHLAGHITDLSNVAVKTMTHWSQRKMCRGCPVLQSCQGTCSFLENELRWQGCDNSYDDQIGHFALAFELVTDYVPTYIEPLDGELPEYRRNIWEVVDKPKRIIPIAQVKE
jgi:uncharacterized protein